MIEQVRDYVTTATEGPRSKQSAVASLNWQGDVVPEIVMIKTIKPAKAKTRKLGEVNLLRDGLLLIGPKTASVVSQFDLGHGALHPIAVEDSGGNIVSKNEYFFWNFGNKFPHFQPEQSSGMKKSNYGWEKPGEHLYFLELPPEDDQLAFSRDCLKGPDVWRETYLKRGTIMSDSMAAALTQAGLAKIFKLTRCRLV